MFGEFWARAGRFTLAGAMLGTACDLVSGVNRLQEVDCIDTCTADAAGPTADAGLGAPADDAATGPIDGMVTGGDDAVAPRDGAPRGSDASGDGSDGGLGGDGSDGGPSSLYIGCFADSMTRDLSDSEYNSQMNTPELCINTCGKAGYDFAGVQNGSECYCGDAYGGQGPSDGCLDPCSGDATELCGGSFNNSVYATAPVFLPSPLDSIGCFADGTPRDLPDSVYTNNFSTPATCVAACTYYGYLYAGVQYSTECFCGDSYGAYGTSLGCIDRCSGDPSKTCGGTEANNVYRTSVTDAGTDAGKNDGG